MLAEITLIKMFTQTDSQIQKEMEKETPNMVRVETLVALKKGYIRKINNW